jgi:hypothetical protein
MALGVRSLLWSVDTLATWKTSFSHALVGGLAGGAGLVAGGLVLWCLGVPEARQFLQKWRSKKA